MSKPSGKPVQSGVRGTSGSNVKPPKSTGPLLAGHARGSTVVTTASCIRARQADAALVRCVLPLVSMVVAAPAPTIAWCSTGRSQKKHSPSPDCRAPLKARSASCRSSGQVKLASTDRVCSPARPAAWRNVLNNASWCSLTNHGLFPVAWCSPGRLEMATFILFFYLKTGG